MSGTYRDLAGAVLPRSRGAWVMMCALAATVAFFQLFVYNVMGVSSSGKPMGAKPAMYFEFAFELTSALITFFFCMHSKFACDREIDAIMFREYNQAGVGTEEPAVRRTGQSRSQASTGNLKEGKGATASRSRNSRKAPV
mmetsp:Transcript_61173/g.115152  ORF Transcript_61173/g.115152 Transcript_61173/m.115152 type:complete len:140 (+) Transcript_61173:85-504(+)